MYVSWGREAGLSLVIRINTGQLCGKPSNEYVGLISNIQGVTSAGMINVRRHTQRAFTVQLAGLYRCDAQRIEQVVQAIRRVFGNQEITYVIPGRTLRVLSREDWLALMRSA